MNKRLKNTKKTFSFLVLILLFATTNGNSQSLKYEWQTEPVLKVPESVLLDKGKDILYVSNINGTPVEKNGKGFISIMDKNGKVKTLKWATGLNAPKGMDIKDGKLYVTDIDRIAVVNTETGNIEKYIEIPGSIFLNDVATGSDGNIYVTDTRKGVIYVLKNNKPEIWSNDEHLQGVNGITRENDYLMIGSKGYLLKGNTSTKTLTVVAKVPVQIDGLIPLGEGKYVVSAWTGKILFIYPNGSHKELFDSEPLNFHTADMGYLPGQKLLLIPTFTDRVIAKKLIIP
ncbi:MAG: ATP-binding protein [Chlorobi bacterium]|nr:ATP-binding protein [Chlorobiota bacterium]